MDLIFWVAVVVIVSNLAGSGILALWDWIKAICSKFWH